MGTLPAQLESSQSPLLLLNVGHVTQRAASGPAGPLHTELHFHLYEYFLDPQGLSAGCCVLESEALLNGLYNFILRKQVRRRQDLMGHVLENTYSVVFMPTGLGQTGQVTGAQTRMSSPFRKGPQRKTVPPSSSWEYQDSLI